MKVSKVQRDLALATASELFQKIVGYVLLMVLARYLEPSRMGEFFFAGTLATFFALPTELGTNKHLIRTIAERPDSAAKELSGVLSMRLPLVAAAFLSLNGMMWLLRPDLWVIIGLTSAYILIGDLYYSFGAAFVGLRRVKLRFATAAAGQVVLLTLVLLGIAAGAGLPMLLAGYVAAHIVLVLVALAAARWRVGAVRLRWDAVAFRKLVRVSAPFFLLAVLSIIHFRVDTLMIFAFKSAAAVASYEAGYKLLEVSRMAVRPAAMIFFPICASLAAQGDWPRFRRLYWRLISYGGGLGLLVSVAILATAGWITTLVWGALYEDTIPILRVLFLTVPALYVGFIGVFVANALHLERAALRALLWCAAINLVLNVLVIPRAGAIGAAWTTLATEVILAGWLLRIVVVQLRREHPAAATVRAHELGVQSSGYSP